MHKKAYYPSLINASDTDQQYCWRLYQTAMKPHIESLWGWDIDWQYNHFSQQWQDTKCCLIVVASRPCGYLQYSLIDNKLYVWMLIIEQDHRSQGIGEKVINLLSDTTSAAHLQLRVFKSNFQAKRFYLKQRFVEIKQEKDFYLLERAR